MDFFTLYELLLLFAYQRNVVFDSANKYSNICLTNFACNPDDTVCGVMPRYNSPRCNANRIYHESDIVSANFSTARRETNI